MRSPPAPGFTLRLALGLALATAAMAGTYCGSDSTGPKPSIALAFHPDTLTIQQGQSGSVTATLTITGSVHGPFTFSAPGVPAGVTADVSDTSTSGNTVTGTITLSVSATTTPGTYPLTVHVSATGVSDATAPFTLIITAAPSPSYTLAATGSPVSVQQGASGTVSLAIARAGGFTGAVAFTLEGAPTGVTGTFTPATIPTSGTTSSLALAVGATVAAQTYNLTVRGKATGLADRTVAVSLTVTAAPNPAITLAVTGSPVTVQQGGSGSAGITITRSGGFTGAVALAVSGVPTGLTATFNPATIPTSGTTSTLNLSAAASLAAQSYTLTVTGSGTGVADKTATVSVNVTTSGTSGNVTLDFSKCLAGSVLWVASQDGGGAWTQATGTGGVYKVTINSATGGIAYVLKDNSGNVATTVQYMTKTQLTGLATAPFCATVGGKTVNGSVAGVGAGQIPYVSLGGASTVAITAAFTLKGVQSGSHDLLAYRAGLPASTLDRVIIQRGLNPPDNGSVGVLDFASASAFAPDSASVTVSGANSGDNIFQNMSYLTGSTCDVHPLFLGLAGTATTMPIFGIPAAQQSATDYHYISVTAGTTSAGRTAAVTFHTMGNQTVTLGATLGTPTITSLTAPYKRLQAAFTLGAEYTLGAMLSYEASSTASPSVLIQATPGFIGGTAATLAMPDFSAVSGWSNAWAPASAATADWNVSSVGGSTSTGLCTNGAKFLMAYVTGQK